MAHQIGSFARRNSIGIIAKTCFARTCFRYDCQSRLRYAKDQFPRRHGCILNRLAGRRESPIIPECVNGSEYKMHKFSFKYALIYMHQWQTDVDNISLPFIKIKKIWVNVA